MENRLQPFILLWLLCGLALISISFIYVVRTHIRLQHVHPIVESVAPRPAVSSQSLLLFDARKVLQTFVGTHSSISHLTLGVVNFNAASPDSTIHIRLRDEHSQELGNTSLRLDQFWDDDLTLIPFQVELREQVRYTLEITSVGIPKGHDISLFFNGDRTRFSQGSLEIEEQLNRKTLAGNIGFALHTTPSTLSNTVRALLSTTTGIELIVSLGLWVVSGTLFLSTRLRHLGSSYLLRKRLQIDKHPLSTIDLLIGFGCGLFLALIITAPFYTTSQSTSIFGDVHRALVYRAVARDSLLQTGTMGLWEPYQCGGAPLLANSESAQLDPLFLLTLLFGEHLGLRLSVTAMLAIGFTGAFSIARSYAGVSRSVALLAGALFSFSGFQMLGLSNGAYAWLPAGWIPWLIFFFLKSFARSTYILAAGGVLAIMFLGGGIHMTIWAGIGVTVLAFVMAGIYRHMLPLILVIAIGAAAVSWSAIKLIPAAELQATSAFSRPLAFVPPIEWIPKMFWDRNQLSTLPWFYEPANQYFRWYDFGTYIGIFPVVLLALSLLFIQGNKLLVSFLGALLVMMGMTYGLLPWKLLVQTEALGEVLRNPQRARSVLLVFLGVLSAFSLHTVMKYLSTLALRFRIIRHRDTSNRLWVIATVLVGIVLYDLISLHRHLFLETFSLPAAHISPTQHFVRLETSYENSETGHYKASYDTYLAGYGTTDSCLPFMKALRPHTSGLTTTDTNRPYRGEAYFERGPTNTQFILRNPNEFSVRILEPRNGWLVINTNFFPGWETFDGRRIWNHKEKLAVRTTDTDTEISFRYRPVSYRIGRAITLCMLCITILVISADPIKKIFDDWYRKTYK